MVKLTEGGGDADLGAGSDGLGEGSVQGDAEVLADLGGVGGVGDASEVE